MGEREHAVGGGGEGGAVNSTHQRHGLRGNEEATPGARRLGWRGRKEGNCPLPEKGKRGGIIMFLN